MDPLLDDFKPEERKSIEDEKLGENIGWTFVIFIIIWTFIIAINRFYKSPAFPILFIPYASMGIGFFNKNNIADDKLEQNIFSATFISIGLVISLPLLGYMSKMILGDNPKADNINPLLSKKVSNLSHIIFLAMIMTLLSYIHIWVDQKLRHVCSVIRSCFEMMAVTLYIYALTVFFLLS